MCIVAIDTDPTNGPSGGNGCSPAQGGPGLGPIDPAIAVASGATFNIDVVVDEIDAADGLAGFSYELFFDDTILNFGSPFVASMGLGVECGDAPFTATFFNGQAGSTTSPYKLNVTQFSPETFETGEMTLLRHPVTCIQDGITIVDLAGVGGEPLKPNVLVPNTANIANVGDATIACGVPAPTVSSCADGDGDGWCDSIEVYLGTDSNGRCPDTPGLNDEGHPDAWPVDFNDDQNADLKDVIFAFVTTLPAGLDQPATGPLVRLDFVDDGWIDLQDVIRGYITMLLPTGLDTSCVP